jgi:hypothetical protein
LQEFIKIAFLMDICALFGGNSQTEGMLRSAIAQCFEKNRRLYTELRIAVRDIGQSVSQTANTLLPLSIFLAQATLLLVRLCSFFSL